MRFNKHNLSLIPLNQMKYKYSLGERCHLALIWKNFSPDWQSLIAGHYFTLE